MKVLYFGTYEPSYARNWVIMNGLRRNGVEIIECREKPGRLNLIKLIFRYLFLKNDFDLVIVGFPGQEVMLSAKLFIRKPIIFDAFTSHYGGYILDRGRWARNSLRAKYFKFLDKWSCKFADLVLLDTESHIDFFVKEFNLPKEKFRRIWIGANDDILRPLEVQKQDDGKFHILFFGTYVPLQGAEYIVRAANILKDRQDIVFKFIGKGQDGPKCMSLARELGLKNIEFAGMMKPEDLRLEIAKSDLVLGLFGNTPKTPLVIPNKVYEALSMRKPVITSDTRSIRELFTEEDVFFVKPADPESLAEGIIKLKNDPGLRQKIADNGHNKFSKFASTKVLGEELRKILEKCLKNQKS